MQEIDYDAFLIVIKVHLHDRLLQLPDLNPLTSLHGLILLSGFDDIWSSKGIILPQDTAQISLKEGLDDCFAVDVCVNLYYLVIEVPLLWIVKKIQSPLLLHLIKEQVFVHCLV